MASKHGKEGVAFSAYLAAVALGDRRPQDGVVPFLDCAVFSPSCSSSRVEPSTSVNRKVTIPVGRSRVSTWAES
jgi:hypothetical protein